MTPQEELAELVDALDHIMRTAKASRTQTKRLRWIGERARMALEGGDWREMDLPKRRKDKLPPRTLVGGDE